MYLLGHATWMALACHHGYGLLRHCKKQHNTCYRSVMLKYTNPKPLLNQVIKLIRIHRGCIIWSRTSPLVEVLKLKWFILYAWTFKSISKPQYCLLLLFFFVGLRKLFFLFKDESRAPKLGVKSKSSSKKLSSKPFNWFILHKVVGGLFRRNCRFLSTSSLAIWSSLMFASTIIVGIRVMLEFWSQFWGSILILWGSLNVLATTYWSANEFEFLECKYS